MALKVHHHSSSIFKHSVVNLFLKFLTHVMSVVDCHCQLTGSITNRLPFVFSGVS